MIIVTVYNNGDVWLRKCQNEDELYFFLAVFVEENYLDHYDQMDFDTLEEYVTTCFDESENSWYDWNYLNDILEVKDGNYR